MKTRTKAWQKNPHFLGPTFLRQSFWHPKAQQKWHTPFIQPDLFIQLSLIFQKISTNFHLPSLFQPTLLRSFWGHMFSFSPGFSLKRQESQKATRPGRKLWSIELCSRLKANDHPNGGESSESLKDLNEKNAEKTTCVFEVGKLEGDSKLSKCSYKNCKGIFTRCSFSRSLVVHNTCAMSWELLTKYEHCSCGFWIRRPESAWLANILCRIQTVSMDPNPSPKSKIRNPKSKIQTGPFGAATKRTKTKLIQNPKSKIRNPKSKIQNPKSEIQNPKSEIQNPKSKIQNPKSKIQNPNGPFGVWILDFGFGRAGTGGDGYVANEDVWPCWPPEFGLVGGAQACNRKVAGSIPATSGPNWAPISGGGVLPEIGARFPAPCSGNWGPISGEIWVDFARRRPCV